MKSEKVRKKIIDVFNDDFVMAGGGFL